MLNKVLIFRFDSHDVFCHQSPGSNSRALVFCALKYLTYVCDRKALVDRESPAYLCAAVISFQSFVAGPG